MATIVTRSSKGSALTHTEMDANFTNLNNDIPNVTTWNAVGSYAFAYYTGSTNAGSTLAGSNLNPASTGTYGTMYYIAATSGGYFYVSNANSAPNFYYSATMSGTWRCMGNARKSTTYAGTSTLWVRIS